jgi:hypothetical protein
MKIRFGTYNIMLEYIGMSDLKYRLARCISSWRKVPKQQWEHVFIQTLEIVPRNWYLELEVSRGIMNWEELIQNFKVEFTFEVESPLVDAVLQVIRGNFFMKEGQVELVTTCSTHRESTKTHELLECYKITEDDEEEENPRDVHVSETEGECDVVGPTLEYHVYKNPLRV